ncbi:MAG: FAD-dependent oxidoreductase [Tissierellia bacterium]|nr:FAD-dependent oxidoreductase [Tissierellia bacterium]
MKTIIIGGVAAGSSTAAKLSRLDKDAEIVIYEERGFISYSACNMPYYIGDLFDDETSLMPRDPQYFQEHYNTKVLTEHRVISVDPDQKKVLVKNLQTGETFEDFYDNLVLSTGASSAFPPIEGLEKENVYSLRVVEDMKELKAELECCMPPGSTAIVIGSGFIGLEMVENFKNLGYHVKLLVRSVVSNLSPEMSIYMETHLENQGIELIRDASATKITDNGVILGDGREITGDFVFVATGAKPNVELAKEMGVEIGVTGAIKTDPQMRTNIPNVYAGGDCTETTSVIDGSPMYIPLGSTANKMGRVIADDIVGNKVAFPGIAGSSIFKLFDMTIGSTGFSEQRAKDEGYNTLVFYHASRSHYKNHGGEPMLVKAVVNRDNLQLLGVEIVGFEGVLARLDTYATYITFHGTIDTLEFLDTAYAPPYSTVRDVVLYTGMIGMSLYEKGIFEPKNRRNEHFLEYVKNRK